MDRSQLFEEMVASVGVGVAIYGDDGCYRYVNAAYADLLGTDVDTLTGTPIWAVVPEFEAERFDEYWNSFADGETRAVETVHEYGDTCVPVSAVTTRRRIEGTPYHFGTIQDISELKQREQELSEQNERLEAFTGVVSHDLRNPLNVAKGYVDILQEDIDRDELELVESSLERMSILVDDLLRLAREGQAVDAMAPVSLMAVGTAARETVATGEATVTVESDLDLLADGSRLQQLLENLIRNAVEHASEDGDPTITIGALADGKGFFVEDDGPGIPPGEREAVFSPTRSEGKRGVGLGLAIVKEIAEAHDWTITVTDGREDGARFEFRDVELH
ncbi:PAS domain-containing sensor histidine kinase [Haloglomus halophilum]|uniref:PAS domain-containing sensor histidine kinase n=1 Tax=Haloglomus halophilum TaxID=2962672 RepID=UPI0020C96665|nr:PAS domain-containing sensor histidine kinase [Haloglomus halophilum]